MRKIVSDTTPFPIHTQQLSKTEQVVFGLCDNKIWKQHPGRCKYQTIIDVKLLAYHVLMAEEKIETC